MFCKNCGAKLAEGQKFCPNCGTAVFSQPAPEAPTEELKDISPAPDEGFVDISGAESAEDEFNDSFDTIAEDNDSYNDSFDTVAEGNFPQNNFAAPPVNTAPSAQPMRAAQGYSQPPQKKPKNKKPLIIGICAAVAVLLIAGIVTAVVLFMNGDSDSDGKSKKSSASDSADAKLDEKLVGTWKTVNSEGITAYYTFTKDGKLSMRYEGSGPYDMEGTWKIESDKKLSIHLVDDYSFEYGDGSGKWNVSSDKLSIDGNEYTKVSDSDSGSNTSSSSGSSSSGTSSSSSSGSSSGGYSSGTSSSNSSYDDGDDDDDDDVDLDDDDYDDGDDETPGVIGSQIMDDLCTDDGWTNAYDDTWDIKFYDDGDMGEFKDGELSGEYIPYKVGEDKSLTIGSTTYTYSDSVSSGTWSYDDTTLYIGDFEFVKN